MGWEMAFKHDFRRMEETVIFRNIDLKHMYWRVPRCGSSKKEKLPPGDIKREAGNPEVESWFTMGSFEEIRDVKGKPIIFFDLDWDKASRDDAKIMGLPRNVMTRRARYGYIHGWRYCSLCEAFYKTDRLMCPVHNKPLRLKPHKKYRRTEADVTDPENYERNRRIIEEFIRKHELMEKIPRNLIGVSPPHVARDRVAEIARKLQRDQIV